MDRPYLPHALASAALVAALGLLPSGAASSAGDDLTLNEQLVASTENFLAAHADLRWRREGMEALDRGLRAAAAGFFRKAAWYGDKPSQAMYASMLWSGDGVDQDRPLAMAWMDLAGERGYPHFIAHREKYWNALTPAEREDAIARGQAVYAEYGDAVAKPRLEKLLQRERNATGSRVGYVPAGLRIEFADGLVITGDEFYQERFWEPAAYWAWQDRTWGNPPEGKTHVGELEVLHSEDGKPTPSR